MLTANPALLELRSLACERDDRLLFAGLDAAFQEGEMVQVLGPNGCGKTTLLRLIAGVSRDYRGKIFWRGQDVRSQSWEFANDLLYLGHLAGVKKSLTTLENLRWYAALQGSVSEQQLLEALAWVKLDAYIDTPCYQLSAGQTRRVALARLAFSKARLWILDEPFTSLDKAGVAQLEEWLVAHTRRGGLVLVTSHQDIVFPQLRLLNLQDFTHQTEEVELTHV